MTGPSSSHPKAQWPPSTSQSSTPQRRITLKINPLKARSSISSPSSTTPTTVAQDQRVSDEDKKPRPKIKIKPLRASIVEVPQPQDDLMDVDTPGRGPSPSVVASPVDVITPAQVAAPEPLPLPPQFVKPKAPRPIKLKPLKEVLQRLIAQIKRKDDYAFFLQPVDPEQVPGYSDAVKNPMDFGTMTEKVEKGRYRSLEQFKDDFLLVTTNAKEFNPPSTMYHTEAAKIEAWGLEQITRSSAHVIEYEADWTIDVVADGEPALVGDQDESNAVSGGDDANRPGPSRPRSPSVLSSAAGVVNLPSERSRRTKSKKILAVTESFEEGWHLPGYKDGVGIFPPYNEFADLMLDLKLRGKKWTKKERLKREKEGPPYTPEGSLDYYELQHPFPHFQNLVPEVPNIPELIPLVTTSTTSETVRGTPEASQPPEDRTEEQANRGASGPAAIPLDALPSILDEPGKHAFTDPSLSTSHIGEKKFLHWTITRNPPRGTRAREDDDDGLASGNPAKRRRAEPTDYGSFATLLGTIAAENGLKASSFEKFLGQDSQLLDHIRQSIEDSGIPPHPAVKQEEDNLSGSKDLIRDVVYGGVDGLAYFRSLAEFVGEYRGFSIQDTQGSGSEIEHKMTGKLGMPLAKWVLKHVVEPLTYGNIAVLRDASSILESHNDLKEAERALAEYVAQHSSGVLKDDDEKGDQTGQLDTAALAAMRSQLLELAELEDPEGLIEIADLLRAPEELFLAESAWAGGLLTPAPTVSSGSVSELTPASASSLAPNNSTAPSVDPDPVPANGAVNANTESTSCEVMEQGQDQGDFTTSNNIANGSAAASAVASSSTLVADGAAALPTNMIDLALLAGAEALQTLSARIASTAESTSDPAGATDVKAAADATTSASSTAATAVIEDAITRRTRLGLIALAKRAPIDRIARLPPELVPVHIRHIVPTLNS